MDKLVITGEKSLKGEINVGGSKNVALKALVAACLTQEDVSIKNMPIISDVLVMSEIITILGGKVTFRGHDAVVNVKGLSQTEIPLDKAAEVRTSFMFLVPILARFGQAVIPNPGGCRIGARPIDRVIEGLENMGVDIKYHSKDGYFHARIATAQKRFRACNYTFSKNTHTGTETLILVAVLAQGKTVLQNAAEEPEIDELIVFLNSMGAKIKRKDKRTIEIEGVEKLHAATFTIGPDRNEAVTFAVAALVTKGDILIRNITASYLSGFLQALDKAGAGYKQEKEGLRFYYKGEIKAIDITTASYPGFMTDWQGPWAVLMTQAKGIALIHETIYENRFTYVDQLRKMGAKIELFNPKVENPEAFYNFNIKDDKKTYFHAARISGPVKLHDGIVSVSDLRAGATLVLAGLTASGKSTIFGVEHLDRGYEHIEDRLKSLGADIKRITD